MKVLFVRSGNRIKDPISTRQGESLKEKGIEIIYFDIIGKGFKGYIKNIKRLRAFSKVVHPNLIHAHYGLSGFIAALSVTNLPVITSLMGSDLLDCGIVQLFFTRLFSKFVWKATIVKTERMKCKIGIKKAIVLPNGIDLKQFFPKDGYAEKEKLAWRKNVFHVLFASDPDRKEKNFPLANTSLEILKWKYGIKADVHFMKNFKPEEVNNVLNASDVILLTSKYEGSPNIIKEAMAACRPIVSTAVGDVKQVISNTVGCYVVSADPDEIAEKLFNSIDVKKTDGREKIKHLSSPIIADKLIDLYNTLS